MTKLTNLRVTNPVTQDAAGTQDAHLVRVAELNAALAGKADKGEVVVTADDGTKVRLGVKKVDGVWQHYWEAVAG